MFLDDDYADSAVMGLGDNRGTKSAFIIDDQHVTVKTIKTALEAIDISITGTAFDGEEALEKIATVQTHIDYIMLDINMPKRDGISILPELVKLQPKAKIIMITALGDEERVKQAMSLGAEYYIVKPFTIDSLYDALKNIS